MTERALLISHIRWLSFSRLTMSIGFHFIQPTLAIIFLYPPFEFSPAQIGIILMLYTFADRGLAVFCAPITDRLGPKLSQVVGFFVVAISFLLLCFISNLFLVSALFVLCGLGFSVSTVGFRSAIGGIADHDLRLKGYSDGNIGVCAGAIIGLVVAFLLPYREMFQIPLLLGSFCFFISAAVVRYLTTDLHVSGHSISFLDLLALFRKPEGRRILRVGMKYILYSSSAFVVYFAFFDLTPLYFEKSIGVPETLGWIFSMTSIMTILFQRSASKLFTRIAVRWEDGTIIIALLMVIFAAFIYTQWWGHLSAWFVSALLGFTVIFMGPASDYLVSKHVPTEYHSYIFGLKITSGAIARSFAVWIGTQYLQLAPNMGWKIQNIWVLLAIIPAIVLVAALYKRVLFLLQNRQVRVFVKEEIS